MTAAVCLVTGLVVVSEFIEAVVWETRAYEEDGWSFSQGWWSAALVLGQRIHEPIANPPLR